MKQKKRWRRAVARRGLCPRGNTVPANRRCRSPKPRHRRPIARNRRPPGRRPTIDAGVTPVRGPGGETPGRRRQSLGGREAREESSSFLKKKDQNSFSMSRVRPSPRDEPGSCGQRAKVSWFFFQKRTAFLAPARPGPWERARPGLYPIGRNSLIRRPAHQTSQTDPVKLGPPRPIPVSTITASSARPHCHRGPLPPSAPPSHPREIQHSHQAAKCGNR
jgi:hypothetical protein